MKTHLLQPNIFKFASSELSQDAFLCWALDGLNYPKCEIYRFAKGFLSLLLQEATEQQNMLFHDFSPNDVIHAEIERQKDHIDILVTLHIKNGYGECKRLIIIEDKTFSGPHNNQLLRYKSKYEKDRPICIYYKTGFLFNDQEYAKVYGYAAIDKGKMISLMLKFSNHIASDIFKGYLDYLLELQRKEREIEDTIQEYLFTGKGQIDKALQTSEGQFILVQKFIKWNSVVSRIGNDDVPIVCDKISRGYNRDGTPWTQFTVLFHPESEAVKEELIRQEDIFVDEIFYRIDKKNKGYYLSVRQYNKTQFDMKKIEERLPKLRKCFEEAWIEVQNERSGRVTLTGEKVKMPRFDVPGNRGRYESEIALYYMKDGKELELLCELFGSINDHFVQNIRNAFS